MCVYTHTLADVSSLALPVELLAQQLQHRVPAMVDALLSSAQVDHLAHLHPLLVTPNDGQSQRHRPVSQRLGEEELSL